MGLPQEIKKLRHSCSLSQAAFAEKVHVAFSTVNRWEMGRATPNFKTMKSMEDFCKENNLDFSPVKRAWLGYDTEDNNA